MLLGVSNLLCLRGDGKNVGYKCKTCTHLKEKLRNIKYKYEMMYPWFWIWNTSAKIDICIWHFVDPVQVFEIIFKKRRHQNKGVLNLKFDLQTPEISCKPVFFCIVFLVSEKQLLNDLFTCILMPWLFNSFDLCNWGSE